MAPQPSPWVTAPPRVPAGGTPMARPRSIRGDAAQSPTARARPSPLACGDPAQGADAGIAAGYAASKVVGAAVTRCDATFSGKGAYDASFGTVPRFSADADGPRGGGGRGGNVSPRRGPRGPLPFPHLVPGGARTTVSLCARRSPGLRRTTVSLCARRSPGLRRTPVSLRSRRSIGLPGSLASLVWADGGSINDAEVLGRRQWHHQLLYGDLVLLIHRWYLVVRLGLTSPAHGLQARPPWGPGARRRSMPLTGS